MNNNLSVLLEAFYRKENSLEVQKYSNFSIF